MKITNLILFASLSLISGMACAGTAWQSTVGGQAIAAGHLRTAELYASTMAQAKGLNVPTITNEETGAIAVPYGKVPTLTATPGMFSAIVFPKNFHPSISAGATNWNVEQAYTGGRAVMMVSPRYMGQTSSVQVVGERKGQFQMYTVKLTTASSATPSLTFFTPKSETSRTWKKAPVKSSSAAPIVPTPENVHVSYKVHVKVGTPPDIASVVRVGDKMIIHFRHKLTQSVSLLNPDKATEYLSSSMHGKTLIVDGVPAKLDLLFNAGQSEERINNG